MRIRFLAPLLLVPLLLGGCAQPSPPAAPATTEAPAGEATTSAAPVTSGPVPTAPGPAPTTTGTSRPPADPSAAPSRGVSSTAPVRNCGGPTLDITLAGSDAGAGNITYTIAFTNRGRTACRVSGAPRMYLIGSDGSPLGQDADGSGAEGEFIRLAPGASAFTDLRAVNVGTDGGPLAGRCTARPGIAIAVDAPNYDRYEQLPAKVHGCTEADVPYLAATVFRPAA